jgi:hypothetical protein
MNDIARPQTDRLELRLEDSYHKAKRALLVATALCIVIGVSAGQVATIPGFGDIGVQTHWAVALIWLGCCYFADEFRREWKMASIRNSEVVASRDATNMEQLFRTRQELEQVTIANLNSASDLISQAVATLRVSELQNDALSKQRNDISELSLITAKILQFNSELMDNKTEAVDKKLLMFSNNINQTHGDILSVKHFLLSLEQAIGQIFGVYDKLNSAVARLTNEAEEASERDRKLLESFRTLHRQIDATQRDGFEKRDKWVPSVLFAIATFTALGRVDDASTQIVRRLYRGAVSAFHLIF